MRAFYAYSYTFVNAEYSFSIRNMSIMFQAGYMFACFPDILFCPRGGEPGLAYARSFSPGHMTREVADTHAVRISFGDFIFNTVLIQQSKTEDPSIPQERWSVLFTAATVYRMLSFLYPYTQSHRLLSIEDRTFSYSHRGRRRGTNTPSVCTESYQQFTLSPSGDP